MHAMRLVGCEAGFRLFPGAHHSFDRDTPIERIEYCVWLATVDSTPGRRTGR